MRTKISALYGLCYQDKKTPFCRIPVDDLYQEKKWRFENNVLVHIHRFQIYESFDSVSTFVGFLSWKFREKTGITEDKVYELCELYFNSDIQLINFSPNLGSNIRGFGNFMDWSDKGHIGIKSMVERCCKHVGMVYENNPKTVVYANLFAARYYVYKDYVETVIKPCLELLEGEMWEEVNREAGYTAGLEKEELKRLTGLDFYNYVPFILERMMMQYIHNKGIKVVNAW